MWTYTYTDELYHHGIKGQKWGKRLYQNKDGSLTALGKIRYRTNGDFKAKVDKQNNLKKAREAKAAKQEQEKTLEEKRAALLKSTDVKELYENRHLLTTNELNERINRIDTEARLGSKIVEERKKTGLEYMENAKNVIDKTTNLFRSVDNAYSTVANSAIGKTLAKQLGIETPKKEFNLAETWKNRNKLSTQEMLDLNKRLTAEDQINKKIDERNKEANSKKEAEAAEARQKEAQKQVDDYNKRWAKGQSDDKVTSTDTQYNKSGDDIADRKVATGKGSNTSRIGIEQVDRFETTGKDVIGKGTSTYDPNKNKNSTVYDAEYGNDYWDVADSSTKNTSMSNISNTQSYQIGQNYIAGLLEYKEDN